VLGPNDPVEYSYVCLDASYRDHAAGKDTFGKKRRAAKTLDEQEQDR
jgi:hypothetical protein